MAYAYCKLLFCSLYYCITYYAVIYLFFKVEDVQIILSQVFSSCWQLDSPLGHEILLPIDFTFIAANAITKFINKVRELSNVSLE